MLLSRGQPRAERKTRRAARSKHSRGQVSAHRPDPYDREREQGTHPAGAFWLPRSDRPLSPSSRSARYPRRRGSRADRNEGSGPEIRHKRASGACSLRASALIDSSPRGASMPVPRWRRSAPTAESRAAPFAQDRASSPNMADVWFATYGRRDVAAITDACSGLGGSVACLRVGLRVAEPPGAEVGRVSSEGAVTAGRAAAAAGAARSGVGSTCPVARPRRR